MPALPAQPGPARSTRILTAAILFLASLGGLAFTTTRAPADAPSPRAVAAPLLNINTATPAQLELLPRIGPTLSARIVEDREANGPFDSIESLARVKGIGPRTIENIRPHIKAE